MTETYTPKTLFAGSHPEPVVGAGTLKLGAGSLARGTVLGRVLKSIAAAVAGTNAGSNGTCTPVALGTGAQAGAYLLTCIGGDKAAAKSDPIGTGNGVLSLDGTAPIGTGAQYGVYRIVCIEPGDNVGQFAVYDPQGVYLGVHTVAGAAFDGQIKFTIADGDQDFLAGDYFTVTISQAVPSNGLATFSVVGPDGVALADAVTGTPYVGEITFTLNDGTNNFDIGDTFTITVTAIADSAAQLVIVNSANKDGSAEPWAILAAAKDATSAAKVCPLYLQGSFNQAELVFGGNDTYATHAVAMRALGMILAPVVTGATDATNEEDL